MEYPHFLYFKTCKINGNYFLQGSVAHDHYLADEPPPFQHPLLQRHFFQVTYQFFENLGNSYIQKYFDWVASAGATNPSITWRRIGHC